MKIHSTLSRVHQVSHVLTIPLQVVVSRIPHPRKKKTVKVCIGICLMFSGAAMAKYPWHLINHIVWDTVAYGLHGYGALPIFKVLCAKFDLENLSDETLDTEQEEIKNLQKEIVKLETRLQKQLERN